MNIQHLGRLRSVKVQQHLEHHPSKLSHSRLLNNIKLYWATQGIILASRITIQQGVLIPLQQMTITIITLIKASITPPTFMMATWKGKCNKISDRHKHGNSIKAWLPPAKADQGECYAKNTQGLCE